MGKVDIQTKEFMSDNGRFADLFNFVLFKGEQVIKPEDKNAMIELFERNQAFWNLEKDAAMMINTCTGMEIEIKEGEKKVNMCKAIQDMKAESREEGIAEELEEEISVIKSICEKIEG